MEAIVDPPSRGPDWKPITPKTGSLLHAETQSSPELTLENRLLKKSVTADGEDAA